jgi:hypothetical protein
LKSSTFWDIMQCNQLKVNRCFGGTYRLHLQGRRISRTRNQSESRFLWNVCWLSKDSWCYIPEDIILQISFFFLKTFSVLRWIFLHFFCFLSFVGFITTADNPKSQILITI